jgi:hypothetical protein
MKVYNLFFYQSHGNLNFWGSFSSELLAVDSIISYTQKHYEFANSSFEQLKKDLKFKASKTQEKILDDQASIFFEALRGAGSVKDIMGAIEKVEKFTKSSFTPFVYTNNDEYVLYHRFRFLFSLFSNENIFVIIETELNEEMDLNIYN